MSAKTVLGWTTLLALSAACGDTPTDPQLFDEELLGILADANPVVLSASGGGQAAVTAGPTAPPNSDLDPFSFSAKLREDGKVAGTVKIRNPFFAPDESRQGDVTCMAPVGEGGLVLLGSDIAPPSASPPPPADHVQLFAQFVRDNGEGANASADQILFGHLTVPDVFTSSTVCQYVADLEDQIPGFITGFFQALSSEIATGDIQVSP